MLNKSLLTNNSHPFDHYCITTMTIIVQQQMQTAEQHQEALYHIQNLISVLHGSG
jgi:hypothetical protein